MKSEILKCRVSADLKSRVLEAAARSRKPASVLLRKAARHVAAGHDLNGGFRSDMLKVRQAANALAALMCEGNTPSAEEVLRAIRTTETLRLIAARHLGPMG
jgi:hypothetical protein